MNRFTHRIAVSVGTAVAATCLLLAGVVPAGSATPASASSRAPAAVTAQAAGARVASYTPPKRTLRYGMSGSDVRALQQRLAALKYYPGKADGVFGSNTLEAVWAFQEVQGLKADGAVGPAAARALVKPRVYQARYPHGGALRVEVNLTTRVLIVYQSNKIALVSHISAGGGYYYCSHGHCGWAITPTGHFHTTAYIPGWVRVPLGVMYNPVFFIRTAYAIHGEYNYNVPVNPVSHGCVRIPFDIAAFFHNMVKTPGTPVYIYK
jgi:lipoprotein-anchoring transpeptidase ErfK/SrfK